MRPRMRATSTASRWSCSGWETLRNSLASYDSALAMSPDQVSSLYMRGIVKLRLGRTEEGRADVAAALAAEPDIADFYGEFGLSP